MSLLNTSRYISLILRHKPEVIGIELDEHGWANVTQLIAGVNQTHPLTVPSPLKNTYGFSDTYPEIDVVILVRGHEPCSLVFLVTSKICV